MKGFAAWAERHSRTFGLTDSEKPTLQSWEPLFETVGATSEDLQEATSYLAVNQQCFTNSETRFLGKLPMHLALLQCRIREQRAIQEKKSLSESSMMGTCLTCGNTGRVIVPRLQSVKDGQWRPQRICRNTTYYT